MRVFGDGAGFSRDGGFSGKRGAGAGHFRRNRRVGDIVHGKILAFEAPGLARALIDGQEMLASVKSAAPGQIMRFLVVSLSPDIVLKELPADESPERTAGAVISALNAQITAFEAIFTKSAIASAPSPDPNILGRRRAFLRWLDDAPEAMRLFHAITAACREASALLAPAGLGRYHYLPWILPRAGRLEALIRRTKPSPGSADAKKGERRPPILWDLRCRFAYPGAGRVSLSILFSRPVARYRLSLENPKAAPRLVPLFSGLFLGKTRIDPELLGVSPLGPDDADLLARALSRTRQRFTGVNLQV